MVIFLSLFRPVVCIYRLVCSDVSRIPAGSYSTSLVALIPLLFFLFSGEENKKSCRLAGFLYNKISFPMPLDGQKPV
jgi:hypothetical protein